MALTPSFTNDRDSVGLNPGPLTQQHSMGFVPPKGKERRTRCTAGIASILLIHLHKSINQHYRWVGFRSRRLVCVDRSEQEAQAQDPHNTEPQNVHDILLVVLTILNLSVSEFADFLQPNNLL